MRNCWVLLWAILFICCHAIGAVATEKSLVVDENGLVGIGTESPTAELEVAGTIKAQKLILDESLITSNPPVEGAYVTGNIYGGELVYNDATSVNVKPFSCMDQTLTKALVKDTVTTVSLGSSLPANTIYHIFAVNTATGTTCSFDTDIDGENLDENRRWLGFVYTDAAGEILDFYFYGNTILWKSANVINLGQITKTPAVIDYSPYIPSNRVTEVGLKTSNGQKLFAAPDGTNLEWKWFAAAGLTYANYSEAGPIWIPQDMPVRGGNNSTTVFMRAVKIRR